jgi:hypothetical protein
MLERVSLLTNKKQYLKVYQYYGDKVLRGNNDVCANTNIIRDARIFDKSVQVQVQMDLVESFKSKWTTKLVIRLSGELA